MNEMTDREITERRKETREARLRLVAQLNNAVDMDRKAMQTLCEMRISVHEDFASTTLPFVVLRSPEGQLAQEQLAIGFVGILSGCFKAALELPDCLRLCAVFDDDEKLDSFKFIETVAGGHYIDADAEPLERYRQLDKHLIAARDAGDKTLEDAILEDMDVAWYELSTEEQAALDTQTTKIGNSTVNSPPPPRDIKTILSENSVKGNDDG